MYWAKPSAWAVVALGSDFKHEDLTVALFGDIALAKGILLKVRKYCHHPNAVVVGVADSNKTDYMDVTLQTRDRYRHPPS
ncbi:MAG: hypothetical protein NTV43_15260 [Methylococcales bacterium]|nr:hypothetical protein [Methylococcales bacterium]